MCHQHLTTFVCNHTESTFPILHPVFVNQGKKPEECLRYCLTATLEFSRPSCTKQECSRTRHIHNSFSIQQIISAAYTDHVSGSLRAFSLFGSLPPELQITVWEFATAAEARRVIQVTGERPRVAEASSNMKNIYTPECYRYNDDLITHHGVNGTPGILYATSDSRKFALRRYRPVVLPHVRYPFYMDPAKDILVLQTYHQLNRKLACASRNQSLAHGKQDRGLVSIPC